MRAFSFSYAKKNKLYILHYQKLFYLFYITTLITHLCISFFILHFTTIKLFIFYILKENGNTPTNHESLRLKSSIKPKPHCNPPIRRGGGVDWIKYARLFYTLCFYHVTQDKCYMYHVNPIFNKNEVILVQNLYYYYLLQNL